MKNRKRGNNRKNGQNKRYVILVAACVAVSAVIGAALSVAFSRKVERTVAAAVRTGTVEDAGVVRDGVRYIPDPVVKSYLFLGVDNADQTFEEYGKGGRTDTIILLVRDGEALRMLEISRDTMTEVDTYDAAGDYLSTGVMQINMQYSFGDSPRRSAYLTRRTVSALLGGVDIDGVIALDMTGIAPIVDAMGGVAVTMEEDCSVIDPAYTAGAEIRMDGDAAERFIRWRDTAVSGGNDVRMDRHTWFIRQMLAQADSGHVSALLDAAEPYLHTDMSLEEIKALYDCSLTDVIRVPGKTTAGSLHDEFYADEDGLREIVLKLFYIPT